MFRSVSAAALLAASLLAAGTAGARAELTFSAYGGFSLSHDSNVSVNNGPSDWSGNIQWDGVSACHAALLWRARHLVAQQL